MSHYVIDGLLARLELPTEWVDRAACIDMPQEIWFPDRGELLDKARQVCGSCPVQQECLEYALGRKERHGTWGGLSERERRRILRRRSAA
jgi:WhiB family redox-sensing transcriptional regulator